MFLCKRRALAKMRQGQKSVGRGPSAEDDAGHNTTLLRCAATGRQYELATPASSCHRHRVHAPCATNPVVVLQGAVSFVTLMGCPRPSVGYTYFTMDQVMR
jgi:hypothetical protein